MLGIVFWGVWILVGKFGKVEMLLLWMVDLVVKWLLVNCMLLLELLVN